jgi:hypothetical protein
MIFYFFFRTRYDMILLDTVGYHFNIRTIYMLFHVRYLVIFFSLFTPNVSRFRNNQPFFPLAMGKGYGTGEGSSALHRYHNPPIKPPPPPPPMSHFSHPIPSRIPLPFLTVALTKPEGRKKNNIPIITSHELLGYRSRSHPPFSVLRCGTDHHQAIVLG